MRSEFQKLNGIDDHLQAAMNHTDFTTSANAIEALSLARCESAVPNIINKFLDSIHQSDLVCNAAVNALKSLGIPKPCDATTVKETHFRDNCKTEWSHHNFGLIQHRSSSCCSGQSGCGSTVRSDLRAG